MTPSAEAVIMPVVAIVYWQFIGIITALTEGQIDGKD